MLQLYTCGILSTIKAIMRASLWIGPAGPGGCSRPGIPMGEETAVPVVAGAQRLHLDLDHLGLVRLGSAERVPVEG
jgi:hypothetical protein